MCRSLIKISRGALTKKSLKSTGMDNGENAEFALRFLTEIQMLVILLIKISPLRFLDIM